MAHREEVKRASFGKSFFSKLQKNTKLSHEEIRQICGPQVRSLSQKQGRIFLGLDHLV